LISAVNVLNELKEAPLAAFAEQAARLLHVRGALLCVEPGTRLGGKLVQSLREESFALGFTPVQPCPHARPCPLQGTRRWCHFSLGLEGTPEWLAHLTREAGLGKQDLHLSFALLQRQATRRADVPRTGGREQGEARVISAPFKVPGAEGLARYGCGARGLLLLTRAADVPSGTLVEVQWPERPRRDVRSGAWIV
jgi:ribosomal protein RSM22 (predicted rRNA methylase)